MKIYRFGPALLVAVALGASAIAVGAQGSEQSGLQEQVEKLNAGQEALRKEILAMQKQLQEIRTLLQARPAAPAPAPQPPLPAELSIQDAPIKGSANAPVTIVEFSDFQCPFCGRHFNQTMGLLDKEYISTGKVKYVFRHFPLERIHPQAFKASEAAECASAQGKFWEMHDQLFANQQMLTQPDLLKHGEAVGLDTAKFASCLTPGTTATRIRGDLALGAQAGVTATPNFFLGTTIPGGKIKVVRKLNGAVPFATFKATIDALLASPPPAE